MPLKIGHPTSLSPEEPEKNKEIKAPTTTSKVSQIQKDLQPTLSSNTQADPVLIEKIKQCQITSFDGIPEEHLKPLLLFISTLSINKEDPLFKSFTSSMLERLQKLASSEKNEVLYTLITELLIEHLKEDLMNCTGFHLDEKMLNACKEIIQNQPNNVRLSLAKACLQDNYFNLVKYISIFHIHDKTDLNNIFKTWIQAPSYYNITLQEMKESFKIDSLEDLLEIFKFCAKNDKKNKCRWTLKEFGENPANKKYLLEILKDYAHYRKLNIGRSLPDFPNLDHAIVLEIIEICAKDASLDELITGSQVQDLILYFGQESPDVVLFFLKKLAAFQRGLFPENLSLLKSIKFFLGYKLEPFATSWILCVLTEKEKKELYKDLAFVTEPPPDVIANKNFMKHTLPKLIECFYQQVPQDSHLAHLMKILPKHKLPAYLVLANRTLPLLNITSGLFTEDEQHEIIEELLTYRNTSVTLSLSSTFPRNSNNEYRHVYKTLIQQTKAQKGAKTQKHFVSHLILPMIPLANWIHDCQNKENPAVNQAILEITRFARLARESFRDYAGGILQPWCLATTTMDKELELSAEQNILMLAQLCQGLNPKDKKDITELKKRLSCIQMILSESRQDLLQKPFQENITQHLSDLLTSTLKDDTYLDLKSVDHFTEKYVKTLGSMRVANAWKTYESQIKQLEDPALQEAFDYFIKGVLEETYKSTRYEPSSTHIKKILEKNKNIWEAWKQNKPGEKFSIQKETQETADTDYYLGETDNWNDLFLSGTEVSGSCQRVDGDPDLNKALLGYVLDGKNKMIAIKDSSGQVVARAMFRLLWDPVQEKPVLYQDTLYSSLNTPSLEEKINTYAKKRAQELGCTLLTSNKRPDTKPYAGTAVSLGSRAPWEYVDALGLLEGVTNGQFTLTHLQEISFQ